MPLKWDSKRPPCWYGESAREQLKETPYYWSAQRHNLIRSCPFCFKMKYIDKIPVNPFKKKDEKRMYGYGATSHMAVELALAGKSLPSDPELAAKSGGMQHVDNIKLQVKLLQEKLKILGLGHAKSEIPFLCYLHNPENPEDRLEIPLFGLFDLSHMFFDGKWDIKIADLKSGAAKWGLNKCLKHYQFRGYTYAGWAIGGEIPRFDAISLVKENKKSAKGALVVNQPVVFNMKHLVRFYEETKADMALLGDILAGKMPNPTGKVGFFCPYPDISPLYHGC